jgi:hypothetical protein
VLVNAQGQAFGLFGFDPKGNAIIKILDERGRTLWNTPPGPRPPIFP